MIKKQIPNLFTLSNLICGLISIWFSFNGKPAMAAYLIFTGALFDFIDGAAARVLEVSGEMGKQLDSLADLISFGVAPAAIAYHLFLSYHVVPEFTFLVVLIPVFSAIRLANFNIDDRQSEEFIGLPTPAHGFFWAGLTFVDLSDLKGALLLPALLIFFSIMLVSNVAMFSLKFKTLSWRGNQMRFVFLFLCLGLFLQLYFKSIPIIVFLYIIISIVKQIFFKKNEVQS